VFAWTDTAHDAFNGFIDLDANAALRVDDAGNEAAQWVCPFQLYA